MAASPRFKVFTPEGEYVASVKDLYLAAGLIVLTGPGSTVRNGHSKRDIIYTEPDEHPCADSYDTITHALAL